MRRRATCGRVLLAGAVLALAAERHASAQDIEVPILVIGDDTTPGEAAESDDELDLANLVTSAAKGVTTVQEAPAIITIITAEELRDKQPRELMDVVDLIPGFMRLNSFYGHFPQAVSRGIVQAVLPLHDGFSMFDPLFNTMTVHRAIPMEMVKRFETISGPGGVLWGANGFMGVINIITKDAEDIDGVQASIGYGDGRGDRQDLRAWVMAGVPRVLGRDDWGLVLHASVDYYKGTIYTRTPHMFSTPLPNPNSLNYYGPDLESDPPRSHIINLDGKLAMGKLTVQWAVPIIKRYGSGGFNGPVAVESLPEDDLPECSTPIPATDPTVEAEPCNDRARATRTSSTNFFERYGLAEYKTRFSDTSGISVKGYFIQFVRDFSPILVLMPTPPVLKGGLALNVDSTGYRTGASLDGDVELTSTLRMLYGVEGFFEWLPDDPRNLARAGKGPEVRFLGPYNLARLPLPCPLEGGTWNPATQQVEDATLIPACPLAFSFEVNRLTAGAFTSLQLRPTDKLILDGGVRLQVAPEIFDTTQGYGLQPTFSAAAVYEFIPDWHVKVNYAEGFRPPGFNAISANGEAVQLGGTPDLLVEYSRSGQIEVNARLLKGVKRIRELDLRFDYAYTVLQNYLAYIGGVNANTGDRGINSAEILAKLYLKGGHRVELGYSFNAIDTADKGVFRTVPNNWFNLSSINPLVEDKLELATIVRVYGAFEDPNRRVESRDLARDPMTGGANINDPTQAVSVSPYETVIDRQAPAGELQVGLRWLPMEELQVQGTLYNAFSNERGAYDSFDDLEPRLEITPAKFEAFRFFASATYAF